LVHVALVTPSTVDTLNPEQPVKAPGFVVSVKVTVPVGVVGVVPAGAAGVTVAVKVTCPLTPEALGVDVTAVVVLAWLTL
jgi:hypothetical protein